jgi:hypothetical protein
VNTTANIFLVVASLATIVLGILYSAPLPLGPDRAGSGVVCFMLQLPRWVCLAVVLMMCVAKGAFSWPSDRPAQYFLVLLVHTLLGLGCIWCGLYAMEGFTGIPVPGWMIRTLTCAPLVIPATQILFAAWFLNPALRNALEASTVRMVTNYALVCFAIVMLGFGIVGAHAAHCYGKIQARLLAESAARTKAEAQAKASAEEQAFGALTPESPLADWLRFTEYDRSEEHRKAAREAILNRPRLAQDLSAGIDSTNAEVSMKLMYFVGELPHPPAAVADAVRAQAQRVVRIAKEIDPAAANSRDMLYEKAHNIAAGVQAAAFGLQRAGVNISPDLLAMADSCRDREKVSPRDIAEGCERIIAYLATPESQLPAPAR